MKHEKLKHSASHIMAQAVMRIYDNVKLGIGPPIKNGFYYDFELPNKISEEDLEKISKEMEKISNEELDFKKEIISKDEAREILKNQPYKLELIDEIPENEDVSIYKDGEFVDLCRGPHVNNTSRIKYFKLTKIAGAYWKGNEKNTMLTRIYGTVFPNEKELKSHLERIKLAKQRDHRKLGKELDLFSIHPQEAGAGLVYWHPRGAAVRRVIEEFWVKEHQKNGYKLINIPHIAKSNLWQTSGHLDFYKDFMFPQMELKNDKENYILKPMNCPGHIIIYKSDIHSYKEFPLRWAELGTVYRYEKQGVLHGLMRVRGFTQDDAHIFCMKEQIEDEINKVLKFVMKILSTFGFQDYQVFLSTRPDKYVGDIKQWEIAEEALKKGLEGAGMEYDIDPGEGVFYGPKIDIKIKDSLERMWQCSTIQVDFNIPDKFELEFINKDGDREEPVMIHRAIFGSIERFFGILIEHFGGRFPVWLAPEQVEIIPIGEEHIDFCIKMKEKFNQEEIRVFLNTKDDNLGKKIWQSRKMQIPYTVIVGDKEIEKNKISVRKLSQGDIGEFTVGEFLEKLKKEIIEKK
ncbi:MAG: threonine--tRNA ligase [Elusimicrobiota bacterium]